MSKPIRIANPLPGHSCFTSVERAQNYVRNGFAVMVNGELSFRFENRAIRSMEQEFGRNRGGVLFWNGAREVYIEGTDIGTAMFPPGCNVLFPRIGTERARKRYARAINARQ